jgi:ankyrin repeat protein
VAELIMLGARHDYKDEAGLTALDHAIIHNKRSVVKILLNIGAWSDQAITLSISKAYGDITNDLAEALLNRWRAATLFYRSNQQASSPVLSPGASL